MTPWLRFWFPHADHPEDPKAASRDAALWTPTAIAETQRELWRHAAQATHDWWRYWRALWPALPAQPPAGVLTPPREPRARPEPDAAEPAPAAIEHRRSPARAPRTRPRSAAAAAAPRPRHGARGK